VIATDPSYDPSLQHHIIPLESLTLADELGRGAEGVVRKGEYAGIAVAVKGQVLMHPGTTLMVGMPTMAELLTEAQAEAQTLVQLRHPNVVMFYGISIEMQSIDIKVHTVLEYASNGDLNGYLMDASVHRSWEERLEIGLGVAKGMAFLHSKGVVHRDLKPANGK
jgi:serine/threonine protein kinase